MAKIIPPICKKIMIMFQWSLCKPNEMIRSNAALFLMHTNCIKKFLCIFVYICTNQFVNFIHMGGCRGRVRLVVWCNRCLSPPKLWVWTLFMARCTRYIFLLCDKVFQWLATCWWFSPGTPLSSTNKTDRHDVTEILLKVAINTLTLTHGIWHINEDLFNFVKYISDSNQTDVLFND